MINLASAALFLLVSHFGLSSSRTIIVRWIGERRFGTLFSLVALTAFGWLGLAWWRAPHEVLFILPSRARSSLLPLVLLGLFLVVGGITTPNPTIVGSEALFAESDNVRGVVRITRNAFLWGVGLVACAYLAAIGTLAGALALGAVAALGMGGTLILDAKKARRHGALWRRFAQRTSNIPFAAVVAGRQRLTFSEIKSWRIAVALGLLASLVAAQPYLWGVAA